MNRITSNSDVAHALIQLIEQDKRLEPIANRAGPLPLRLSSPGFTSLAEIIVSQHVSKHSAAAVFERLTKRIKPMTAEGLIAAGSDALVEAGLTRAKQQTLKCVAESIIFGDLDLERLHYFSVADAQTQLMQIKGIGRWTAEVYLLLCAGHVDVFPAGDVALRHAVGVGLGFDQRPSEQEVREIAEKYWAPWRGIAARLFWKYYAQLRNDQF